MDGFYRILMRERDFFYTAMSNPNGILWKWLVMPQAK